MSEYKLKHDSHQSSRGEAHLLNISCTRCETLILKYQKDGKGNLLRCYINRIFYPEEYSTLQNSMLVQQPKDMPNLECQNCKTIIGTPIRHDDGRLAYRLIKGTYMKKREK